MNGNFSSWTDSVKSGVGDALHKVVVGVPDVLAAIVVVLIGVIVGVVLKNIVVRVLHAIKLKPLAARVGLERVFPNQFDLVNLVGDLVKWFFIIVFLLQGLSIAHLQEASDLVSRLLGYVPNVLIAAVVLFVGAVVADLTARFVRDAAKAVGASTARFLSDAAKYTILTLVFFTALAQLGVNTVFLDRLFTGVVVMLALAGGLAFGLGGQSMAKDVLAAAKNSFKRE